MKSINYHQPLSLIKRRFFLLILFISLLFSSNLLAQTGKISGRVLDENGQPLIGTSVLVEGTQQGASADFEGYYSIINVRAGSYALQFRFVGYKTKRVENVRVSADKTTTINATLEPAVIEGEMVVVTAERPLVEFNQTSSVSSISAEDIKNLPVQSLSEIVNLQAGVIDGHFRGGRLGEVQYQVDGVTVNNPFNNSSTLQLDKSILEEVQVISGTFDAKYGQAMSGVVNAVLRSGSDNFEWSGEFYNGSYFTGDTERYPNNNSIRPLNIQNYQMTISGPTFIPATTFFLSGRRFLNNGHLFGTRRFLPTDRHDFAAQIFNPTGDNELVSMSRNSEVSGQFKITNKSLPNVQLSYQAILFDSKRNNYEHGFRLNPDGIKTNTTFSLAHGLTYIHTLSEKMFFRLNLRQNYFSYTDFMYEDLYDPRYLTAGLPRGDANYEYGSIIQGVDLGRFKQKTDSYIFKWDLSWQANRYNFIEFGLEAQTSEIVFGSPGFIVPTTIDGREVLMPRENIPRVPGIQTYFPFQFAAYLQDRVELGDLIIRAGVRFEYFDAAAKVPSDLQNPANTIEGAPESRLIDARVKYALAPRVGFSFPITDLASMYFSYGHFYQLPGLGLLYNNSDYSLLDQLQAGGISYGVMGNPDLEPEKTIQYEFGLKHAIGKILGTQLSFFYKDIRDLLGVEFISTYTAAEYGRFVNIDFGNVYGITLSLTQQNLGNLSTSFDYTLQFASGNSSDPRETANRAAAGKDPRPRTVPFNWDQRNTINASVVYFVPDNFSLSTIIRYGSGQPFTPEIGAGFGADLETNSGQKKSFLLVDLRGEKYFTLPYVQLSLFFRVFNLFNNHFVNGFVFSSTGSPDYSLTPAAHRLQLINPARFHEPRRIEIGISFRGL